MDVGGGATTLYNNSAEDPTLDNSAQLVTFAHVADLLFEDVVPMLVNMGPQEVFKSMVDLQACCRHRHPLSHCVTLHIFQVFNAFNHLFIFVLGSICSTLCQPTFTSRAVFLLFVTV